MEVRQDLCSSGVATISEPVVETRKDKSCRGKRMRQEKYSNALGGFCKTSD